MKKKALYAVFAASWMLCGCSLECIFESPKNSAITLLAAVVAIACAIALGGARND